MQVFSKINLDLLRPAVQVIVNAKQNDKASRFIQANLWEGGQPFAPVDVLAVFRAAKPDGTATFYDTNENGDPAIVINGNVATIELVEQVLTVPGDVAAELNLYTADGEKLTSFTFTIRVQASVLNDAEISSSDYFNILTNTLTQAQAAADRAEAAAERAEDLSGELVKSVNGQTPDSSGAVSIDVGVLEVNNQTPDAEGAVTIDVGVMTVNNQTPDENGNVNVQAGVSSVFGREGAVTAQPGDYNISQITGAVRPNLLDNWYFGNPVNQRGQTEYNGAEYTVDRWKKTTSDGAVTMTAGGITATNEAGAGTLYLSQYLGGFDLRNFDCVFSVLTENGLFLTKQVDATGSQDETPFGYLRIGWSESANCSFVQIQITQGNTANILAAKLEIGEGQTLAHQDADGNWVLNEIPDYAEELAKCQRYQVIMSGLARYRTILVQANSLDFYIPTPVTMRAVPAFSVPTARITSFTSSASFTDATWSVVNINPAGVYLRATKSDHGFTDARADLEGGAIFDANL